jgi:hypothetical protein
MRLSARFNAWFDARLPLADHHSTGQRNTYILPTGAGVLFGAVLLVLLLASINYQLNLGYALTFLLAGAALAASRELHDELVSVLQQTEFGIGVSAGRAIAGHIGAHSRFEYTVIDLGSIGLADPSLVAEIFTETVLEIADKKLIVCLADPIGIFRLLATEQKVLELASDSLLLMNRVRNSVIPVAKREIPITLQRLSQLEVACYLPDDPQQIDQAIRTGVPAVSLSRSGLFRQAMTGFVRAEILGSKGQLDSRVAKLG